MIFKPGDKVYSYRHGIVTLVETEDALTYGRGKMSNNRQISIHRYP